MARLDGASLSYQHPRSGEWAHDVRDPLREAHLVSVDPAWELRPPQAGKTLRWIEVGFGRGVASATALRRLLQSEYRPARVEVDGCEAYPQRLEPWPAPPELFEGCCPWWGQGADVFPFDWIDGRVHLVHEPAPGCFQNGGLRLQKDPYDWIFLDLFSPGRHAEEWHRGLLEALTQRSQPGTVLTSFTCARVVRDGLTRQGWEVEVLRREGLRDTLRARFAPSVPRA